MSSGGARNRNGIRKPDPNSARSDRRGITLVSLPREGYDGKIPTWPLSDCSPRERVLWRKAWRTPQAVAWIHEPWRWEVVAMWVRWTARAEDREAPASTAVTMIRLADQIGMTPAGLKENGWQIARDEMSAARAAKPGPELAVSDTGTPTRRLRSPLDAAG